MGSRQDIIREAASQLGKTNPDPYWAEVGWEEYPTAWRAYWCGAFAMAMLKRAHVLPADAKWKTGIGFVYPYKLPMTDTPEPGDIAYRDQPFQHHMLVESYNPGTGELVTIAGNELNPQGGATIVRRAKRDTAGLLFFSVRDRVTPDSGGSGSLLIVGGLLVVGAGLAITALRYLR